MIQYIQGKVGSDVVVSTCQKWGVWAGTERAALVAAVDVVFANIYPFWDKADITDAITQFESDYNALAAALPTGKQIVVSETGWATAGGDQGSAVPNTTNEQTYWTNYAAHATKNNIVSFWFEMFDEPWKCFSPSGTYETTCNESHFGAYTSGLPTAQSANTISSDLSPTAQITTQSNSYKPVPFPPAPSPGVTVTFIPYGNIQVALDGGSTLGPWSSGNKTAYITVGQNVTITWENDSTTMTMNIKSLDADGNPTWEFVSGSQAGYNATNKSDANLFVPGSA